MLEKKDYASANEVRWCPGCGDYAILNAIQKMLAQKQISRENTVFVSGIGCSSRLPYYLNCFGLHTIHGRAPAFATGLKLMRPELDVWVITGDGDGLSIGLSHLQHAMRRNININILLFNNKIYGLTKGQYSPTSELNKMTKSSPLGSQEEPINPISVALAANCSFIAREIDVDSKNLEQTLVQASQHHGCSFIEILQNCNVFNDKAFANYSEKQNRGDNTIRVAHGTDLVYGKDQKFRLNIDSNFKLETTQNVNSSDKLIYDATIESHALTYLLAELTSPLALGVLRSVNKKVYAKYTGANKNIQELLNTGHCWQI